MMRNTPLVPSKSEIQNLLLNVVIPVYGEKEPINEVINQIPIEELKDSVDKFNIYIVYTPKENDGNLDITFSNTNFIKISILKETNRGYGQAYQTGFSNAEDGIVVTFDADGKYPLELLPKFVRELINDNVNFISINRLVNYEKEAFSKRNLIGNIILTKITNILFRLQLKDSQSGMWVFKSELLNKMDLKYKGMEFSTNIKIEACKATNKFREIPGFYKKRIDGSAPALNPWKDGYRILKFLFTKKVKIDIVWQFQRTLKHI